MKTTHGIKIAMSNKSLCYKMLLCRIIIYGLVLIPLIILFNACFSPFFTGNVFSGLLTDTRNLLKNFILIESIDGNLYKSSVLNALISILSYTFSMPLDLVICLIGGILVIQVLKFLSALCDYVFAVNVNEHMSSIHHQGFFTTLIENFVNAVRYAGYRVVVLLLYNFISIILGVLIFYLTIQPLGGFSISLVLLWIFVSYSIRLTFSARVLPRVVCENKKCFSSFFEAFKTFKFSLFMQRFMSYLIIITVIYTFAVISSIITFGVAVLIAYPIATISFISIRFVDYYTTECKKYYICYDEIIVPKELRDNDEKLLNKVDI